MVKRYMFDVDGGDCYDLITYQDQHGLWVRHRDYEKLADLCGRMADAARKYVHRGRDTSELPPRDSIVYSQEEYENLIAAIAEWEAMK